MHRSIVGMLIIGGLLFGACQNDEQPVSGKGNGLQKGPTPVEGMVLTTEMIQNKIYLNGNIMANEEVQLQPEIAGRITKIYFSEGQYVNAGKLLVKLNDDELKAQLKKSEVALELAEQDENRKRQLLDIKAISAEEYDLAATMLKSARADVELLQAQIDKTEIRAPFSGIIGLRMISSGTFVTAGQVIANLLQTNPMKLDFAVPEKYGSTIRTNSEVLFQVEGIRDTFEAKIYAIDPTVDLNTRSFRVRATTNNSKGKLKNGAYAEITVILEDIPNAVMIPASAVVPEIRGQKVLMIREGKVSYQLVELGARTDKRVYIEEGLSAGDTIITSGLIQLREGMPVVLKSKS